VVPEARRFDHRAEGAAWVAGSSPAMTRKVL
jgi:hypothetical protein